MTDIGMYFLIGVAIAGVGIAFWFMWQEFIDYRERRLNDKFLREQYMKRRK